MCATCCFLFPIDVVPLLTYGYGYYEMADMPKSNAIIQVILCLLSAIWLPVICRTEDYLIDLMYSRGLGPLLYSGERMGRQ